MKELIIINLFFIISCINSNIDDESYTPIRLQDFTKINFNLNNEYLVFEYNNNIDKLFNLSIFFIFGEGKKASTKVYIYDSLKKIKRGESGFINYLYQTSLKESKYFKISYDDSFYKDQMTYYIVLHDISSPYSDFIYVLNSLNFFPLEEELSYNMPLDEYLLFNFIIQKNSSTYLHYQGRGIHTMLYEYAYIFRIKNEKDETFIDGQSTGLSGYVKIEPNIKYYVQVVIAKKDNPTEFMLSFEKYKENHLLEYGKEKDIRVLYAQHFSFFKNISNLTVNDTMKFNIKIDWSGFHTDNIYIKYYELENFENLVDTFPSNREDFDSQIGSLNNGGNFNYDLIKKYNSQKGVLIGIFIDDPGFYWE